MEQQNVREKILWAVFFILVLLVGFYAGRVSMAAEISSNQTPIRQIGQISTAIPTVTLDELSNNILSGKYTENVRIMSTQNTAEQKNGTFTLPIAELENTTTTKQRINSIIDISAPYVASKKSTLYHVRESRAAQSIKPENLVQFQSKEEAEQRGFRPGSDVK